MKTTISESAITVTFKSNTRSARVWSVCFDLGNAEKNGLEILRYAHRHSASIVPSEPSRS